MLCQNSINDLELPIPLEDGKHYVSFKDKEELLKRLIIIFRISFKINNSFGMVDNVRDIIHQETW
jgi:hypothetical protein